MTPTAHEALIAHIKAWEEIAAGTGADTGKEMPLCKIYLNRYNCEGCPVAESGHNRCGNTPMRTFYDHHDYWHWRDREREGVTDLKALKKYSWCSTGCGVFSEEAVTFLKSLLKEKVA